MKPKYRSQGDSFAIENYNEASPFSSFFPALAGEVGKPMWLFYTNRGQCISSFGINNKDGSMLEFLPANKAYQATPKLGFRTFIRSKASKGKWSEPFSVHSGGHQKMVVRPYELEIFDQLQEDGVEVSVLSFGVPSESEPLLARQLTFKNLTNRAIQLDVVDGLPRVVPFGMNDYLVKNMSRTIEAFAEVVNSEGNVPFFKLKIEPSDRPELQWLTAGFFSVGINGKATMPVIVDPSVVFGSDTTFDRPHEGFTLGSQLGRGQMVSNIMPSCMHSFKINLQPKESKSVSLFYGFATTINEALSFADRALTDDDFVSRKRSEMKKIYEELVEKFGLRTGNESLNAYGSVTFMDNVLRGGYPRSFGNQGPILHVYSRKHGDMERDYNNFQISATYFSQGNGNFRDVNQNRRHDLFLNPHVAVSNVEFFFNLLQLDGFNPLVINPVKFLLPKDVLGKSGLRMSSDCQSDFEHLRRTPILAGELYEFVAKHSADPLNTKNLFRDIILECTPQQGIQHGEGFWVDHWIYNLDHLDQFLAVFPEKKLWLFFEKDDFTYYDADHFVRPRREKYVITKDGQLRQYGAVVKVQQKADMMASRANDRDKVRTEAGNGPILKTNLFTKLLGLIAVKISSLDPFGTGLEMEADKPGWCDALNGLPGLFGSSSHEMFELARLVRLVLDEALPLAPHKSMEIPYEMGHLIHEIETAFASDDGKDFFPVWDALATARETFREKTFYGVSGKTKSLRLVEIERFLNKVSQTLDRAIRRAFDAKSGLPTSYFTYEVEASKLESGWRQYLGKLEWKQHRLVPFLEGAVHAFKMLSPQRAAQLYKAVKKSDLFDKKLGMYKLNVDLVSESTEIGRIKVFSAGWLENESIFLHMHYKYLLEVLRAGMYDEFLEEAKTGLIPFRDPEQYGRPNFENSSFIASSSFPSAEARGKGFVARLSGATSEFLSMVYFMAFGRKPFQNSDAGVVFTPEPCLPVDWFTKQDGDSLGRDSLRIRLFGVPVVFVTEAGKKAASARPVRFEWILDGRFHEHEGKSLPVDATAALREGRLESLTIHLSSASRR